jgi:hypothetical protein
MSTPTSFQETWQAYQAAVGDLYRAPAGITASAQRSAGEIYAERLESGGQEVVDRSAAVRNALETHLESDSLDQRELASLKLLAAAAHDLSVASDLLEMAGEEPGAQAERSGRGAVAASADLRSVLDAPMEAGIAGLLEVERGGLPMDLAGAKAALEAAITGLLRSVPENAAGTSQTAAVELGSIGFGPVKSAASLAVDAILDKLPPEATPLTRRAAQVVVEAVKKIRTALGKDNEQAIRGKAAEWAEEFEKNRGFVSTLLDMLYETERIGQDAADIIAKAPGTLQPAAYNQATEKLNVLQATSDKTSKTLNALMKVMTFVKLPLLAAAPWGTLAVSAAYLGVLGYTIYSNGDILDWRRTGEVGWLDRVEGLRTVVRKSLNT